MGYSPIHPTFIRLSIILSVHLSVRPPTHPSIQIVIKSQDPYLVVEQMYEFLKGVSLARSIGLWFPSVSWMMDIITFYMLSCHNARLGFLGCPLLWVRDRIFPSFPGGCCLPWTCIFRQALWLKGQVYSDLHHFLFSLRNTVIFTMIINILADIHVKFL